MLPLTEQAQEQELQDPATAQDADEEMVLLPAGTIQAHAIRLRPGEDLVPAMENAAAKAMSTSQTGSAFVLSSVGSVESLTLRMANAGRTEDGNSKVNEIKQWDERMEIVSLVGTFASNGKHLHMSVSDVKGHVYGGHLVAGRVFTTLELVLGTIQNVRFDREMDESTGYNELAVRTSKS
jgi:predicted DNA-binding protein with PD1-like motif